MGMKLECVNSTTEYVDYEGTLLVAGGVIIDMRLTLPVSDSDGLPYLTFKVGNDMDANAFQRNDHDPIRIARDAARMLLAATDAEVTPSALDWSGFEDGVVPDATVCEYAMAATRACAQLGAVLRNNAKHAIEHNAFHAAHADVEKLKAVQEAADLILAAFDPQ